MTFTALMTAQRMLPPRGPMIPHEVFPHMALASFLALALMAADPQTAAAADVNAPMSTQPGAARPAAPVATPVAAASPTAAATAAPGSAKPAAAATTAAAAKPAKPRTPAELADDEPLPAGAPSDDYGFVAWCHGALKGHMDLFEVVKPTLNALPDPDPKMTAASDAEMLEAGAQYLSLYERAMDAAEKASPEEIKPRRTDLQKAGGKIWGAAQLAEPKTRMWSWAMWVLPGRCEYAAERLYEKSMLKGQALGVNMRTAPIKKTPKKPERDALGSIVPR